MPSIGSINCTFVHGDLPSLKQRVEVWQTAGVDGYGAQTLGLGDAPFRVEAVLYGTPVAVNNWALALQALQGTVQQIINDWGSVHPYCLLARVSAPRYSPALHAGGARAEVTVEGVVC